MYETLQIVGYLPYQVVNAGFLNHQQYLDDTTPTTQWLFLVPLKGGIGSI